MLPFEDRYTRQRQLAEVGPSGQERIAAHTAQIALDATAPIARLYLQRAGVLEVDAKAHYAARQFAASSGFAFDASRTFADGCLRALWELRSALGMTGSPPSRVVPRAPGVGQIEAGSQDEVGS